jgi:hypothetical protein
LVGEVVEDAAFDAAFVSLCEEIAGLAPLAARGLRSAGGREALRAMRKPRFPERG